MSQEEYTTKRKGAQHLTNAERKIIERLLREKVGKKGIARLLHRDIGTIRDEIKRGSVLQRHRNPYVSRNPKIPEYLESMVYYADVGQQVYEQNRCKGGAKRKIAKCIELVQYVEIKVLGPEKWSPDAVIGQAVTNGMFEDTFTTKTFYNWIDEGLVSVKNIDLRLKLRRRPKRPCHERKKKLGRSIEERPATVDKRIEFGHWEGDGMVGKDGKGQLITLVERTTGMGLLINVQDRKSERIVSVLDTLEAEYGCHFKSIFKSITLDNGTEFSDSAQMERDGRVAVYYAHPYSAWERGINENRNGLVRRFIPKGRSFDSLDDNILMRIVNYINTMPRKRLGYRTSLDLWNDTISAIMTS